MRHTIVPIRLKIQVIRIFGIIDRTGCELIRRLFALTLFGLTNAYAQPIPQAFISITPAVPIANQPIHVRVSLPFGTCFLDGTLDVVRVGDSISLVHKIAASTLTLPGTCSYSADIAGMRSGNYKVIWIEEFATGARLEIASANFAVGGTDPIALPMDASAFLAFLAITFSAALLISLNDRRITRT